MTKNIGVPDGFDSGSVTYGGVTYTLRELSVEENDEIEEASRTPDGFNPKLNLRLALERSIVDPPTSVDQIAKWPGKKYVVISREFNRLNTAPVTEGNDSGQSGSAD